MHSAGKSALRYVMTVSMWLAACLCASAAVAAQVRQEGWRLGSAVSVDVSSPAGRYRGQAGEFSGSLDGKPFLSYCVDLFQDFGWGTTYSYDKGAVTSAFAAASLSGGGGTRATDIARLYNSYYAASFSNTVASGAFQQALWEIVSEQSREYPDYDHDGDDNDMVGGVSGTFGAYNLLSGAFRVNSDGAASTLAATWLSTLGTKSTGDLHLSVLLSGTNQDFVTFSAVPLPGALGGMLMGCLMLGFGLRHRRTGT